MNGSFTEMPAHFDKDVRSQVRNTKTYSPHCQCPFVAKDDPKPGVPPPTNTNLLSLS